MEIVSDDEVFRAALAFVDAFAAENGYGAAKPPPTSSSREPSPSKRLREELLALRGEAEALERQLISLQSDVRPRAKTSIVLSACEALASRQKKRRRQAEHENEELRTLLREQTHAARRLEKLIRRRCWEKTRLPRSVHEGFTAVTTMPLRRASSQSHDELVSQVHSMYTEIYTIFGAPRFAAMGRAPEPTRSLITRNHPQRGSDVEMLESRVYPYDFRTLSDAVWHPLAHLAVPGQVIASGTKNAPTDTAIDHELAFETGPPVTPDKRLLRSKVVARRMRQAGAEVVVWAMALDATFGGQNTVTNEKLWMLVRPLIDIATGSAPASIVQTYVQSTRPLQEKTLPGPESCRRQGTTNIALNDYEACLRAHMDDFWAHVEDRLVSGPTRSHGASPTEVN